jgi:hypothetical protein
MYSTIRKIVERLGWRDSGEMRVDEATQCGYL